MTEKKVLVAGASGGLGCAIVRNLTKRNIPYLGTYRNQWTQLSKVVHNAKDNIIRIDFTSPLTDTQLNNHDFKYAISTIALSSVDKCFREPIMSFQNNVMTAINAYLYCSKRNIPFYWISTNDIFGGKKNVGIHEVHTGPVIPWSTEDLPVPQGVYAVHKRASENQLLELLNYTPTPLTIVRLSLISFFNSGGGTTFIKSVLDAMKNGGTVSAMIDQYVNPVFTNTAAETLIDVAEANINHKFLHISTQNWLSRYQYVLHVIEKVKKIDINFIHPEFKVLPCTLQDLYDRKILTDKRPQYSVLEPSHGNLVSSLEEEIDKALEWYFKT